MARRWVVSLGDAIAPEVVRTRTAAAQRQREVAAARGGLVSFRTEKYGGVTLGHATCGDGSTVTIGPEIVDDFPEGGF